MKNRFSRMALLQLTLALLLLAGIVPVTAHAEAGGTEDSRIIQVLAGERFSVGLRADGTVVCAGELPEKSKAALAAWQDITRLELFGWAYVVGYSDAGVPHLAATAMLERMGYGTTGIDWSAENFDAWTDIVSVKMTPNLIAGLRKDGTVLTKTGGRTDRMNLETLDTSGWRDVISLHLYNDACLIGLKKDGTVETTSDRQLNYFWHNGEASDQKTQWRDIEKIQTDYRGIFAFKKDGSVLGTWSIDGSLPGGKPMTGPWDNLSEIIIGSDSVFGLHRDGSVTAGFNPNDPRLVEVGRWKNIRQLSLTSATRFLPVGLCRDGTVRVVSSYEGKPYGEWNVEGWQGVEKLFSGSRFTLGLKQDGTVLATGGEFGTLEGIREAETWTDIVDISHSDEHILGLKKDGTVVALGNNDAGQCNVGAWTADKLESEMPPLTDPTDEEQLRQRAVWFYDTHIANPNKLSAGKNRFSVEDIMNVIRIMNGEFMRDSKGSIRYNDTDLVAVANVIHTIGNYDSFVQYGTQIFFTPTSPLFVDGSPAREAAQSIDARMEKVVAAIRAEDDEAFIGAAADWAGTVQEIFVFPDMTGNAVSIHQVKAPDSFFLYHCMNSKYASTILEYSQLHHLQVMVPAKPGPQAEEQEKMDLAQMIYNLNERTPDLSAAAAGNQEYPVYKRSMPEDLFDLAKEYFNSKYRLEQLPNN